MTETHLIMAAMNFSQDDLRVNQEGRLSESQRTHLQHLQRRTVFVGTSGFLLLALMATGFIFMGQQQETLILSFAGMMITICNAIFIGIFGRQWLRLSADLRDDRVERISGVLERVIKPSGRVNNYVLRVSDVDFSVSKDIFKSFQHEHSYHMYRAPHSGVLFSAEAAA